MSIEGQGKPQRSGAAQDLALLAVVALAGASSIVVRVDDELAGAPGVPPTGATATPGCVVPKSVRIAVIGDYGACTLHPDYCEAEAAVAHFVRETNPEFVITVGDNDYNWGEAGPNKYPPPSGGGPAYISNNNSRVYRLEDFPTPYSTLPPPSPGGIVGEEAFPPVPPTFPPTPTPSSGVELYEYFLNTGRFFVALGNHDWRQTDARPNKDYFQGIDEPHPAGPVEVFVVDTNQVSKRNYDPDGEVKNPPDLLPQAPEVAKALNDSAACWKILYMHHPAFSQGLAVHR